jgi:1-acyl-sn-glycerol-3-phosphate acyltransferase
MLYRFLKALLIPVLTPTFRPDVKGLRNVPASGPVIIASNHNSFSDSVFLPLVIHRKVTFLAKSEYFTTPGLKGLLMKLTFTALGQVPIDRSGGRRSEAALHTGLELLASGAALGIYPEGTRSPDGRLYKGRTGIARLALESGAPVIPVAMFNTEKIQPEGKMVPKLERVGIIFGEPMFFDGDASDVKLHREITDEIMMRIKSLGNLEYVDIYASDAKREMKSK